jgi:hypothetical protein
MSTTRFRQHSERKGLDGLFCFTESDHVNTEIKQHSVRTGLDGLPSFTEPDHAHTEVKQHSDRTGLEVLPCFTEPDHAHKEVRQYSIRTMLGELFWAGFPCAEQWILWCPNGFTLDTAHYFPQLNGCPWWICKFTYTDQQWLPITSLSDDGDRGVQNIGLLFWSDATDCPRIIYQLMWLMLQILEYFLWLTLIWIQSANFFPNTVLFNTVTVMSCNHLTWILICTKKCNLIS